MGKSGSHGELCGIVASPICLCVPCVCACVSLRNHSDDPRPNNIIFTPFSTPPLPHSETSTLTAFNCDAALDDIHTCYQRHERNSIRIARIACQPSVPRVPSRLRAAVLPSAARHPYHCPIIDLTKQTSKDTRRARAFRCRTLSLNIKSDCSVRDEHIVDVSAVFSRPGSPDWCIF